MILSIQVGDGGKAGFAAGDWICSRLIGPFPDENAGEVWKKSQQQDPPLWRWISERRTIGFVDTDEETELNRVWYHWHDTLSDKSPKCMEKSCLNCFMLWEMRRNQSVNTKKLPLTSTRCRRGNTFLPFTCAETLCWILFGVKLTRQTWILPLAKS